MINARDWTGSQIDWGWPAELFVGVRFLAASLFLVLAASGAVSIPTAGQNEPPDVSEYATHFNRGNELMRDMRFYEAAAEFREAVRLKPESLPAHQALAVAYATTDNLPLAWKEVRLLHQAKVEMPRAFLRLLAGEMPEEEAIKELESIEKELAEAQTEQVHSPAMSTKLGEALFRAGDYTGARQEAERVLQFDADQPDAHLLLGQMQSIDPQAGDQAIAHLKTYLQFASHEPANAKKAGLAYRLLAGIHDRTGDYAQALTAYEEGLKVAPTEAGMWNNAAWIYATVPEESLRNPERALEYARKAVALSEGKGRGHAAYLDTLAQALYLNGRFEEAVETEKEALSLSPDSEFMQGQLKRFEQAKQQAMAAKH
ncbi:MAG TPA: tetratricopeptide repeat protein [Terriglobales bacterium]|nr:tetratricopeptide repeat protein [Terriglobales bacterium]